MPKVTRRSSRLKKSCGKKCSHIGCQFFAGKGKHCSSCTRRVAVKDGLCHTEMCNRYKAKVERLVKKLTISDSEFKELLKDTNGEVIAFLKNVAVKERALSGLGFAKLMFTAKQVEPLMKGYGDSSVYALVRQKEATINFHDKILGRVLDHWNLGKSCFPGTVRCYWGFFGEYLKPTKFYAGRHKVVWSNETRDLGLLKPLMYCARVGDNEPTDARKLAVVMTLGRFKDL